MSKEFIAVPAPNGWVKTGLFAIGLMMVVIIGICDFLTGTELPFQIFYLLPVLWTAWFCHMNAGLALAFASVGAAHCINLPAREHLSPMRVIYLNDATYLIFYMVAGWMAGRLKGALEQTRALARTDLMTGLLSARAVYDIIQSEIMRLRRYQQPFTAIYIDLDNFKHINDRFGHKAGDEVLKAITQVIREKLRLTDTLGRIGGDEFFILLPETNAAQATLITKRLHNLIAEKSGDYQNITVSIGVITCIVAPASPDHLIQLAEKQLHLAKQDGRNRIHFAVLATLPA